MNEAPVIDTKKCNGCGLCASVCQCGALVLIDNVVTLIATKECDWCTECEIVCSTGALSFPFEIVIEES